MRRKQGPLQSPLLGRTRFLTWLTLRFSALVMQDNEVLLYKRFENGKLNRPRNQNEVQALSSEQVDWLMKGFAISPKIKNTKAREFYWLFVNSC
ncbi:IS66 family element Orf2 protein [Lactobacillus helveticus CIRM-BIA 103]|nr:IS66 family element Orf2 protein [Lactobacillus helveticus CIRM-BIA 103]